MDVPGPGRIRNMATDKRERQRQNRAAKQAEQAKIVRKQKVIATAKRVGVWVVVGVALLILANIVWG
jgi:predicted phage tail protein